jgi:hypothetical protein
VVDLVGHTVQLLDYVFAVSHCPCIIATGGPVRNRMGLSELY